MSRLTWPVQPYAPARPHVPFAEALVPDVELRTAVAAIRALGRAGVRVGTLAGDRWAAGLRCRHAIARAIGPRVAENPLAFAKRVSELAERWGPLTVYPSREETIDALFGEQARVSGSVIRPFAGPSALRMLRDKSGLGRLAASVGLRSPRILATGGPDALARVDVDRRFVIKPAHGGLSLPSTRVINSRAERDALLESLPPREALILQEHVCGNLLSLAVVVDREGVVRARFMERATHTWPAEAGSVRRSFSVEPDDDLISRVGHLLVSVGYWGAAQLDFIETRSGRFLVDINTRYHLGLPLALACGVNLPAVWHAVTIGQPVPRMRDYAVGVPYRWLASDIFAALRGDPTGLMQRPSRRRVGAMWQREDPIASALLASRPVASRLVRPIRRTRALTAARALQRATPNGSSRPGARSDRVVPRAGPGSATPAGSPRPVPTPSGRLGRRSRRALSPRG